MRRSGLAGNGERCGWQRKKCSKATETRKTTFGKWECTRLECEVKASDAVLLKKDGNRNWGERKGQAKNGGTLEHELNSE